MATIEEHTKWSRQTIKELRKMQSDWEKMARNQSLDRSARTAFLHCSDTMEGFINRNKWINNRSKS